MITSYRAGYYTGRLLTKVMKVYVTGKVAKKTFSKIENISKCHKIDSKDAHVLTNNVFECLQYLE